MPLIQQAWRSLQCRLGQARPLYVHYGVTHRCNARCRMCVVWKSADPAREVDASGVDRMAEGLTEAGVRMVALGGGEPFVRSDLPDLVSSFARRSAAVRLLTNGIDVSDEQINDVVAAGLQHVSISLDTLDPVRQAEIYSGRDVWQTIVDCMRRFRERLPGRCSMPIMNVCVSRANIGELSKLVELAVELGFFCSFIPITLSPSDEESDGYAATAPDMAVRPQDHGALEDAYRDLMRLKSRGAPIANSSRFLKHSLAYLKDEPVAWRCDAGTLYFSVSPEGDISICHRFPPVARFDTPDLGAYLCNPELRRKAVRERRACPGCMRPCWAEVTHAMHHLPSSWEAFRLQRSPTTPAGPRNEPRERPRPGATA